MHMRHMQLALLYKCTQVHVARIAGLPMIAHMDSVAPVHCKACI